MPEGIFIQTNTGDIQIDGQSSHLYLGRKRLTQPVRWTTHV